MQHTSGSQSGSSMFSERATRFKAASDTPLATAVLGWQHALAFTRGLDSCRHSRYLRAQLCSGKSAALRTLLSNDFFCTHFQLHLAQLGLDLVYFCRLCLGGHWAYSSSNCYCQELG